VGAKIMTNTDRQPVEILQTRVPCTLSKSGFHMLTIGISASKNLVLLNATCQSQQNKQVWSSAHMLGAVTCGGFAEFIRKGFSRTLISAEDVRRYLDPFSPLPPILRKTLYQIWLPANQVSMTRAPLLLSSAEPSLSRRKAKVITDWLRRHLPKEVSQYYELEVVNSKKPSNHAILFHAIPNNIGADVAELGHNGKLNLKNANQLFANGLGLGYDGECLYCGVKPTRPSQHAITQRHRKIVGAIIRKATHLLNDPKILKLIS
jgi:hypothetical protein